MTGEASFEKSAYSGRFNMIAKYARLFRAFAKASFVADLEYRMNFVSRIMTDIFWYLVYASCPPWLLPETRFSWLVTPLLNGALYAGVALSIAAVRRK